MWLTNDGSQKEGKRKSKISLSNNTEELLNTAIDKNNAHTPYASHKLISGVVCAISGSYLRRQVYLCLLSVGGQSGMFLAFTMLSFDRHSLPIHEFCFNCENKTGGPQT